jgi:hypothetical protein
MRISNGNSDGRGILKKQECLKVEENKDLEV